MAEVFLPDVLMRGRDYQQKGYVLNARLSDGLLKARVKGSSSNIYNVHIDLKSWPGIPARCSCPSHINCKHAAASLLSLQVKEKVTIDEKTQSSFTEWMDALQLQEQQRIQHDLSQEVMYLLEVSPMGQEHRIIIRLAMARRLKRGGLGKKTIFNSITTARKQYFSPEDEVIIAALLFKCDINGWFDRLIIRNSDLLQKILETGRAWLANEEEEVQLALLPPRSFSLEWHLDIQGKQRLQLQSQGQKIYPLFLDKIWYHTDTEIGFGLADTLYTPRQLQLILEAPPVTLEEASMVASAMKHTEFEIPLPKIYEHRQKKTVKAIPVLQLDALPLDYNGPNNQLEYFFLVNYFYNYGGIRVSRTDSVNTMVYEEKGILIEIDRDIEAEKKLFDECQLILPARSPGVQDKLRADYNLSDQLILMHYHYEDDLSQIYHHVIPLLKKKGWQVEFHDAVYEEIIAEDDLEWYSELQESGHDFFSYQLGILIDGKPVSIVPLVAELIAGMNKQNIDDMPDDEPVKLSLPDGKRLQIAIGRIKPLIRFILHYGARILNDDNHLRITRYQLLLMQETEQAINATALRWRGGETLRQQLQQLLNQTAMTKAAIPSGLQTTLREYQQQGLSWLQFLRTCQFGGVLADDMGLGKTVQTLAHLQLEKEQGRLKKASLIIAPTSLVGNWQAEAHRFTPDLKILVFHGIERHQDSFDDYDLIVSTYGLIQRDKARFIDYQFYYLILDEAQFIKNSRTKTTQIIQQIPAEHRLCLSGTPLENHLGELWSLFHFLMPGLLGDAKQFRKFFKTPIERNGDTSRRQLLANRVRPFMLRRSKNQVARELPAKTEIIRTIDLAGTQRDLYEAIRMTMEKKVRDAITRQGIGKSHIVLLDALLKLRQVCCDPRLLTIPEAQMAHGNSAKLDTLMELLDNLLAEGRRVLVFSQFTSMLALIEEEIKLRRYGYLKLTGQTTNRQQLVNTFQEGNTPIFLISLKAGGTGLNLTSADTVIHFDPWWNPAAEDQATDRSHRIGQENPVFVYKLITNGTVEEAILAMQSKKRQLIEGVLSEQAGEMTALTANDIEQFFMPIH